VGGVTLIQLFALGGPALLLIALLGWAASLSSRITGAYIGDGGAPIPRPASGAILG